MAFVRRFPKQFLIAAAACLPFYAIGGLGQPSAQSTGLVAAYSFNEGSGSSVTDLSGNNLTGNIVGATWATGKYGGALSFNGTSSYVDLGNPTALRLTGSMTLEAWINAAANPADDGQIIAKSNNRGWQLKTSPDTGPHTFGLAVSPTSNTTTQRYSNIARALNTWYHLAGVYDATARTMNVYVNGVLDNGSLLGGSVPGSQFNANINVNIGRRTGGFYFNGRIDEVRVYSRALSQTEVQTDMNTPLGGVTGTPDLTLSKSHTGSFTRGQVGGTYLVRATNVGGAPTTGTVTVTDTLPAGLTATALAGSGWTCTLTSLSCSRSSLLNAGSSYPDITVTVNVAANAASSVTNVAAVSGGGDTSTANNTANDPTTITSPAAADLTISKTHTVNFVQGQNGVYTLRASNVGSVATNGSVTVSDSLPSGLAATGLAGPGWTCVLSTASCSRSDALAAGGIYPDITLTVAVAADAPLSVTNAVTVSGGGDATAGNNSALDVTAIAVADGTPPGAPGTLSGSAPDGTHVNLSWVAATDNVGVVGYRVERCNGVCTTTGFVQVGSPTTTTFSDSGLTPNTIYSYRVRAEDGAGNAGAYGNPFTVTTPSSTSALVAAYAFNDGIGTTASDASGNGRTGSIGSAAWTTNGKFGGALSFNGTSAKVVIADAASLRLSNAMTLEAWVSPTTISSAWRDIVYKGNDDYYLMATTSPSGYPGAGGTFGSVNRNALGAAALPLNTWTHVATTYDGATLRMFVNGVQVSSVAQTGALTVSASPLEIGGDRLFGQFFSGLIDEVRVFNVARSATEIAADMSTPIGAAAVAPDLTLSKTHAGIFLPGQTGAIYTLRVTNVGTGATNGTVTLEDALPTGLTATAIAGAGWTCTIAPLRCSRGDALASGTSYPDVTLMVDVAITAPASVINSASVGGGGETNSGNNVANDFTAVAVSDGIPPSAPGTLSANAPDGTHVSLSWGVAIDNIGVADYRLERCDGVCTTTGFVKIAAPIPTTFVDSGLSPNTTYSYIVRAEDSAGNLGPYSNPVTVTTGLTIPELVAAYAFDEGSGNSTGDASGNGRTGTTANTTWVAIGKYGGALRFNGTNAKVVIPDAPALRLSAAMTLEAWVSPTATSNAWRDVIYKGNDNYYLMATTDRSGYPGAGGTFGSANDNAFGVASLPLNVWTHLAATYDGATLRLYVNGTQVSAVPRTGALASSANPLEIGGDQIFGQFFAGLIDEVRVFNVARAPSQIASDMATPLAGNFPQVSLAPSSLTFAPIPTGTTSPVQTIALTNSGAAPLLVGSVSLAGANAGDFAQTNTCVGSLAPATSCIVNVSFNPTAAGNRLATLTIADNAPGSPHTETLSGTAVGFSIVPTVSVLTPNLAQQFAVAGGSGGSLAWSVDGVVGGSPSTGTITAAGLYSPPGTAGAHIVSVTDLAQTSSATVHVTAHPGVFTHHNDNARTGQNLGETVLAPSNVSAATFGKLRSFDVDGMVNASPLYVAGVSIPVLGIRNVIYVATQHNSVYAFDADGLSATPLWQKSFLGPGITAVPASDTGECCDIAPEIGITGTPVIDQATGTLYVVAKTKESSAYRQRLHALDIATGNEKFGGPVLLQASVPGTGQGSVGGSVAFNALHENQRPALLLSNGVVYIAFGSHGDVQPYHGWVLGYSASTLQQTMAVNLSPNAEGGGIWQANGGPAADAAGNIYVVTSNGTFDTSNTNRKNYGDSYVKLSPSGAVLDFFTPHDQANIDSSNFDLGAAGPMLLPTQLGSNPNLLIGAGKNNNMYLLKYSLSTAVSNPTVMGGFSGTNNDNQIVQSLVNIFPFGTPEPGNYSAPVYFNGSVYFSPIRDNIQEFRLTNGVLPATATSRSTEVFNYPGASMAISANGASNGILWAVQRNGDCGVLITCPSAAPGVLKAYSTGDLSNLLYSSDQVPGRDALDFASKFSVPLVANGKVIVASMSKLTIYGLLP